MKNLGNVSNFLSLEIENSCEGIFYCNKTMRSMVEKFGVKRKMVSFTPLDVHINLKRGEWSLLADP